MRDRATLTVPGGRGYGARPMPAARHVLAVSALALAAACTPIERPPAPLDAFAFPTGLGLSGGHLLVVSSNADLTYEDDKGGSLLSLDPEGSVTLPGASAYTPPVFTGGIRVPSFGGPLVVADPVACELPSGPEALFASRLSGDLYRVPVAADGSLTCGQGCAVNLAEPGEGDPLSVTLACVPGLPKRVFVGWRRSRIGAACDPNAASTDTCAVVSEVSLGTVSRVNTGPVIFNAGAINAVAYDATTDLLFFATSGSRIGWVDLSTGCQLGSSAAPCSRQQIDLGQVARGAAARNVALSTPAPGVPRRLYALTRLLDPTAASVGVEVQIGGALIVLDLEPTSLGSLAARPIRTVPLTTGVSEMLVLPRSGKRDVVAITAIDDGEIWFYDDEIGEVTGVLARGQDGVPLVGLGPFAMAAEDRAGGVVRIYVTAFHGNYVTVVDVNDLDDPDPLKDPPGVTVIGRISG